MGKEDTIDTSKKANDKPDDKDKDKDKKKEAEMKDDKGKPLSEMDIKMFKRYGKGPYSDNLKKAEDEIKELNQKITSLCGIKESDTGLALPA